MESDGQVSAGASETTAEESFSDAAKPAENVCAESERELTFSEESAGSVTVCADESAFTLSIVSAGSANKAAAKNKIVSENFFMRKM